MSQFPNVLSSLVGVPLAIGSLATRFGIQSVRFRALPRVVYYEKLGIAFNRIKKNANTSMVVLLNELEHGLVEHHDVAKRSSVSLAGAPISAASKLKSARFIVVVRNPYTRVLSAFLDKFRFAKFTLPYGNIPLDKDGFGQFLRWLAEGGLSKNAHWDLQHKLMLLPLPCYDKVIRFERLQQETVDYLREIGIPVESGHLSELYPTDQSKQTKANQLAASFYDQETLAIVRQLFRSDFDALEYEDSRPPWQ
jgi:hypothetical protein